MADVYVVLNDAGEVVDLRRGESQSLLRQVNQIYDSAKFHDRIFNPQAFPFDTTGFRLQALSQALRESPALSDDQRAELRAVYNQILPGDQLVPVQLPPAAKPKAKGEDSRATRAAVIVFVDP